jgi:hypothetical protein
MRFLVFLKFLLVLGLMAAGVLLFIEGLNIEIPLITFKGLEAHGVPIGIAVICAGIALARFWKIETKTNRTYETTTSSDDGTETKTKWTESTTYTAEPPDLPASKKL